jgi:hypothetical protein
MHKLAILFLMGSLVMLLPFVPNMNIISNAIAFDDYGDQTDQYMKYADNMANDNTYKSVNSNFKKIKCNNIASNINGDNNSISFGSSNGVGAESIQDNAPLDKYGYDKRNNGNFDLHCLNNNEGGIPGPEGPPGQRGPSGITQLNNDTTYTVRTPINVTEDDDAIGEGFARCDSGDFAISGGYVLNNQSPKAVEFFTVSDEPLYDAWHVRTFSNFGAVDVGGTVIVKCFDNPPLNTLATSIVSQVQQQPEDSPLISQALDNSPKLTALEKQSTDLQQLTAMEKITKLKTQWLDQLQ